MGIDKKNGGEQIKDGEKKKQVKKKKEKKKKKKKKKMQPAMLVFRKHRWDTGIITGGGVLEGLWGVVPIERRKEGQSSNQRLYVGEEPYAIAAGHYRESRRESKREVFQEVGRTRSGSSAQRENKVLRKFLW